MGWSRGELFRITGLYLLIIPFLNALNATGYVNSQVQGHFGASATEFAYMNLIPVFVLIGGIPLALEMAKQFPLKSLLLSITVICIILNTASAYAPDAEIFTLCRSLLAFFTIFGIVATIPPIAMRYNPAFNMAIMYGIFQFIIQGSSHLYKFLGAHSSQFYDWKVSLLLLNINFFICMVLTLVFLKKDVAPFKKPFTFDFIGWLLLMLFLTLLLFITAEGQTREWFSDNGIKAAAAGLLIITGIYMWYSQYAKAPLISMEVFRYKNVVLGTLFFFMIGMLNGTGSVIMGFMAGLLGFSDVYMANTHLYTCMGLFISIPVCTYMLFHRIYLSITAIAGFFCFTVFHLLMYFRFFPGISETDFIVPIIFKGMGIGFLYVLSSLYISENIPKHLGTSRMLSGLLARNVFAMLLGASVLGTFISEFTLQHKTGVGQQITTLNEQAYDQYRAVKYYHLSQGYSITQSENVAGKSLLGEITEPAMLLAYKDVYLIMAGISFVPIIIILLLGIGRRSVQNVNVDPIPI